MDAQLYRVPTLLAQAGNAYCQNRGWQVGGKTQKRCSADRDSPVAKPEYSYRGQYVGLGW